MLAAAGPHGCAGPTLLGHGFRVGMLADLVGEGLATARRETMRVGKRNVTMQLVSSFSAGFPAWASACDNAIEKQLACEAASSSSGVV